MRLAEEVGAVRNSLNYPVQKARSKGREGRYCGLPSRLMQGSSAYFTCTLTAAVDVAAGFGTVTSRTPFS